VFAAIVVAYVVLAELGLTLGGHALLAPPLRPAAGLSLAVLLVFGLRVWPAVFVASLVVVLRATQDPELSMVTATGRTLGAIACALLITRFASGRDVFRTVRSTLRACGFVVVSAWIPTAGLALLALVRGDAAAAWADMPRAWLGYVTGTMVIAPCVLLLLGPETRRPVRDQWREIAEGVTLLLLLGATSLAVFAGFAPFDVKTYPLEFLCLPFILWAAFRFGPREVTLAVALVAAVAVWGTVLGVGPFAAGTAAEATWLLQGYVAVMSITGLAFATAVDERRRAEAQLHELATTDPLTGLANYRRLLEVMKTEIARSRRTGRPFTVLLLDLDGLKRINDRYGHLAGSRALCRVADVLRRSTRETDVASRFGGDEFAIVLPESDDVGGSAVLARVADRLALENASPVLSVSGGHAVFPRDGDSPTLLLRAADARLYAAKHRTASPEPALVEYRVGA
jgi:diguanylate cyclase (GGDEF)-like protein